MTAFAKLDSSFLKCIHDQSFRDKARRLIAGSYFSGEEQVALCAMLDIPVPSETQVLRETASVKQAAAVQQGREARFRLTVIPAYNYTCALTGYRLVTITSGSIVDAAIFIVLLTVEIMIRVTEWRFAKMRTGFSILGFGRSAMTIECAWPRQNLRNLELMHCF